MRVDLNVISYRITKYIKDYIINSFNCLPELTEEEKKEIINTLCLILENMNLDA